MRIEVNGRHGELRFIVIAENETDRAILTMFTSEKYKKDKVLGIGGHTYSCDVSAVIDFNFGWHDPYPETKPPRKRK